MTNISYKQYTLHIWQDDNKWYSCRSSTINGIYSESDDLGPFDSRQEAINEQKEDIKAYEG